MVYRDRSFWPYLAGPLLGAAIVYVLLLALGFAVLVPMAARAAESFRVVSWLSWGGSTVVFGVLWALASGPVFLAFAGIFSGLTWDRLSRRVEERLTGRVVDQTAGLVRVGVDTALRSVTALVFALAILLFGSLFFGLVAVGLAGFLGLADTSAPAYARRGVYFPGQPFRALRTRWGLPFAALAGLSALVPFLNLLLVPGFVAAATALCAADDPA